MMNNTNNFMIRGDDDKILFPNLNKKREAICCSLFEVEKFLCDFQRFYKYIELYKILK